MKWIGSVVLAAVLGDVASAKKPFLGNDELVKTALKVTQGVKSLRDKEAKRKQEFTTKMRSIVQPKSRLLENEGQYNYYNYNNNANGQDGANNGYYYGDQYQDYYWNEEMAEEEFGFDISAYSVKYTGCHTVETYNENLAQNDQFETVLGQQRYATFRLCPTEMCNVNNKWGCDANYGEYVVPLKTYVESIVAYGQERVLAFCEFCEDCAAREAYRAFAKQQINQMAYDIEQAEELFNTFKEQLQAENAYNQAAANNGGYYVADDAVADDDGSDAKMMVQYYQKISNAQKNYNYNNGNYNNNNNNNNNNGNGYSSYNQYQQGQNPAQSYNYYSQNVWDYSGYSKNNNNNNKNNQNQNNGNQQKQDYWSNMGQFATFNGHNMFPGYFSNQGEFVQQWGYFINGQWVSMEDNEVVWDENQFGTMPDEWADYIGVDPDEIEQCEYQYSSNCYQNYDMCMMYLSEQEADDEWYQMYQEMQQQQYDNQNANGNGYGYGNNNGYNQNQYMQDYQNYVEQQQLQKEYQFQAATGAMFGCEQVFYQAAYDGDYNQDYKQQQYNNAQFYQLNKYMEYQMEECNGNEACEYDIQTQMEQNQEFMEWLAEYNENLYDQWVNGEKLYYVGATCDDDGIELAVYNDEDCSYADQTLTVEKVLGFDPMEYMTYDLIPDSCIPCDNMDYMQDQYYFGEEANEDGDGDGDGDYEQVEGVTPMCSMLYQIAGKCNENLNPQNLYSGYYQNGEYVEPNYNTMYQSYSQQQSEDLVCSFVESLNSGTYDQSGQVYLDNSIWSGPAKWQQGIANASRNMPGGLKAALVLTALAAALMGVWACMLHGALARKNIPWQPRRGAGGDAVDLARQNSGIVMGRSRSGPVTHPLI